MDFNVQLANQSMAEDITDVLLQGQDEGFVFPPDRDVILQYVKEIMNQNGGIIGVIYDHDNKLVEGVIGLRLDKFWFSDQWFIKDIFMYVHPEFRRSTRAKCLIAFAKDCAKKMNIPLLMGIMSNIRTEAKAKLYERQMNRAGSFFVYNNESVGVA